jgi:adenylosuccinate lyase
MISRYDCPSTSIYWTDEFKFETFLNVEIAILESLALEKKIPFFSSREILDIVDVNVERIREIENTTRHDVVAFCQHITEQLPQHLSRWFHYGVTSSDIIDTTLAIQLRFSINDILKKFEKLLTNLRKLVKDGEDCLVIGRTHGQHGEPMLLAQKWKGHLEEFERRYDELVEFSSREIRMKCSGAVGNYTVLTPEVENRVAKKLNLIPDNHSTQIVPRDRIAKLINIGALYASALERLCVEIRHMSRTEVDEVREGFSKGQTGSSTMPHKSNPISCENLTGISRIMRSHVQIALEDCVTWHERDISHSSCERVFLPDHLILWSYSLERMSKTIENLVVKKETMKWHVEESNTKFTSLWLHEILSKTEVSREYAYSIIQKLSQKHHFWPMDMKRALEEELNISLSYPTYEEMLTFYHTEYKKVAERYVIPSI